MKKFILGILIGGIVFGTIGATAAYVYTASDIGYQPQDNTWNVTNADEALTSLKSDLNNVNTNVTEYKQQITEALADKGVSVDENSSMADITSGISNMSSGATLVGTYSGNKTIDVSSFIKSGDTADNFIIEVTGLSSTTASKGYEGGYADDFYANAGGSTITKTLTDGSLSITGAAQTITVTCKGYRGSKYGNTTQSYNYKVWYVG